MPIVRTYAPLLYSSIKRSQLILMVQYVSADVSKSQDAILDGEDSKSSIL